MMPTFEWWYQSWREKIARGSVPPATVREVPKPKQDLSGVLLIIGALLAWLSFVLMAFYRVGLFAK